MAPLPASLGSQASDRDRGEANVVTRMSQWADNHLRLVQNISTGMAIAGIVLLIRSVRLVSHQWFRQQTIGLVSFQAAWIHPRRFLNCILE
ncbi:similar to hypothetical protein E130311K13 (predicted), isoform CRA_a [Rattus norvegicus]|uniref:Uncharacterized protein RGD1565059_predicted n=1 Tax=Rattus norvegicus TaxID=10116 RepID=A6JVP3_RAT|nr:similar to hypothetical protein E130311K13 (predicted), isoform CRA_a [Rattus norvegicus]